MQFSELTEGAVLANQERVESMRVMVGLAGGNKRFKVSATHQRINGMDYQKLTLKGIDISDPDQLALFNRRLNKRFKGELAKIVDSDTSTTGNITLFFKYDPDSQ